MHNLHTPSTTDLLSVFGHVTPDIVCREPTGHLRAWMGFAKDALENLSAIEMIEVIEDRTGRPATAGTSDVSLAPSPYA